MKRIAAYIVVVWLFCSAGLPIMRADMLPPVPKIPDPPKRVQEERQANQARPYPIYAITAGVVAVALTGSLIALRSIRKRNGN